MNSGKKLILLATVLIVMSFGCGTVEDSPAPVDNQEETPTVKHAYSSPPSVNIDRDKKYTASIETNKGAIIVELFADEAPITVNNFVFLAQEGFYKDVIFHRIIKGFMVQTGDPTGTGMGGPGYKFDDEPVARDYLRGTLAMANAGPNTNGSQFFIVHQDAGLPKAYTIFGIVRRGFDVLDDIATVPVTTGQSGENSQPLERVFIESIVVSSE